MFLASARLTPSAPLGLPPKPPPSPAWSMFGSSTSTPWGASSLFYFPFTMPTPSPPPQLPVQAAAPAAAAPNHSFDFNFGGTDNATNPFLVSAPQEDQSAAVTLPARRRESKFAPLLRRKDPEAQRRQRRDAYMAEVRERRDATLWETRGESSLQRNFLDEQRAWEQEQAREAEAWMPDPTQFEEEDIAHEADDTMEEVLPELDDDVDWAAAWDDTRSRSSYVWESDDEYDALMMEIAAQAESMQARPHTPLSAHSASRPEAAGEGDEAMVSSAAQLASPSQGMDMSLG